jgi:hypothetical protein
MESSEAAHCIEQIAVAADIEKTLLRSCEACKVFMEERNHTQNPWKVARRTVTAILLRLPQSVVGIPVTFSIGTDDY